MKTKLALVILAIAFVFFGGLVKSLDADLETKNSPNGINSFQMSGNSDDASMIRSIWREEIVRDGEKVGRNRISVASASYFLDYIFLFAYGGLLYLFVVRSNTTDQHVFKKRFVALLPVGAMAMDGLENTLSLLYLNDMIPWLWLIPMATFFKFALVALSIIYMKKLLLEISEYAQTIFGILWVFRIVVISLLVLYLALWQADQGQDLLINLNSHWVGPVVFFTAITILASVHWHLPKFLSTHTEGFVAPTTLWGWVKAVFWDNVEFKNLSQTNQVKYIQDSDLARGFGVATFLIPAFGVLNVLDKFKIYNLYPHYFLVACLLLVGIALNYNWLDNAYKVKRNRWVFHLLLILFLGTFILLHFLNLWWPNLIWLFIGLVLLAFSFLIVVSIRREFSVAWLQSMRLSPIIASSAGILALVFVIANLRPYDLATAENESVRYSTISILILALIFYILFFSILIFLGRTTEVTIDSQRRKVNVAGIFLVMATLFAMMVDNRFHDINLIEENALENPAPPPSVENYFAGWLSERMPEIDKASEARPYPIFIVSTYGGGIRAAAWTSLAIATLDKRVAEKVNNDDFQNHVFAYSGASGGTIGASVMCALRKEKQVRSIDELVSFYRNDFLSPVVIGLIGRDFFSSTFGFNFCDRAVLQEEIWEHHMNKHFGSSSYKQSITKIWDGTSYSVPLLFANTIQVESGVKGVVAPVSFRGSDFPAGIPVAALVRKEEMERRQENPEHKVRDLKLSTAAFFSARFPFISPAGRVNAANHFLDGGIYENSGAETAGEIAKVLRRIIDRTEGVNGKVRIIILSLKNSPPMSLAKVDKNLFELSAPLKALVSNVDGNAIHADSVNRMEYGDRYYRLFPQATDAQSEEHKAILPLGWQLSDNALRRLQVNLTPANLENEKTIAKILNEF